VRHILSRLECTEVHDVGAVAAFRRRLAFQRFLLFLPVLLFAGVTAQTPIYTCPMHPAVRGQRGDRCPVCSMPLVRSAKATDAYTVDIRVSPQVIKPGERGHVRFVVREPNTGTAVRRFEVVHERLFHLFVVSHDLTSFAHIHPTLRGDGALEADFDVPTAGAYQLIADFMPLGGPPQLIQRSLVTAGYTGSLAVVPALAVDITDKRADGTTVSLTMPDAIAGREQLVTFDVRDDASGAPITDLEPFLGAPGHVLLVNADLTVAMHAHPVAELSSARGPTVVFQVLFPGAGMYRLWVQLQRHGHVLAVPFTISVRSRV
jgi:hypothetical protein